MILRARQFEFRFPRPVLVMGILNVTPDSFSDGGLYAAPAAAMERALEIEAEGADWVDLGGESTRPGAPAVDEAEELRRVMPVIERLSGRLRIPLSIDTQKAGVARAALAAGASMVNDISAGRTAGPAIWEAAAERGAGYVLMHMQGTPATMQNAPAYGNVVQDVLEFLARRLDAARAAGMSAENILLDVGIGFGKTAEHNLELLGNLSAFKKLQRPLLLGVSRKSFLGKLTNADVDGRLAAGLACVLWAADQGADLIRTHDVRQTRQALRLRELIMARRRPAEQ